MVKIKSTQNIVYKQDTFEKHITFLFRAKFKRFHISKESLN